MYDGISQAEFSRLLEAYHHFAPVLIMTPYCAAVLFIRLSYTYEYWLVAS